MWLMVLVACADGSGKTPTGGFTSEVYAPPWATHLMFRQLDPEDLSAIDTAATLSRIYHVGVSGAAPDWTLTFSEGEDYVTAEQFMTWTVSTADGIALTSVDGETFDPPITLVSAAFQDGESVTSGPYRATPTRMDALTTWYGEFEEVLQVRVDGDTIGDLYLAQGVGLAQFTWGDVAGDLAWYE